MTLDGKTVRVAFVLVPEGEPPARWLSALDRRERDKARAFRFDVDRRAYVAGHALLRHLLGEATGLPPDRLCFSEGPFGKPVLETGGPEFNLSHCRGCVAVALSGCGPVGVDVESAGRQSAEDTDIARGTFSAAEVRFLASIPDRSERGRAFIRLWTRKEAYLKATGQGMHLAMDRFEVLHDAVEPGGDLPAATLSSVEAQGFRMSAAVLNPAAVTPVFHWDVLSADKVLP